MSTYLLPVEQINTNITNCFIPLCTENAFATVCNYMGIEYQYSFAYATNFSFSSDFCDTGRVADGIFTSYNFIKYFEDVYNVSVEQKHFSFFKSYIKYLEDHLSSDIPIIAHFDSYYIPWSTLYNVRHTSHLVVVIGIDTSTKSLIILDPIDLDKPINITYSQFKDGSHFCLKLQFPEPPRIISHEQFVTETISSPDTLISSEVFNDIHELALCISKIFNPHIEFRDCLNHPLMLEEKLIDDIRKLMQGINMFTVWLQWFNKQTNIYNLDTVIEEFKSILSKWNICINMLFKRSLTSWEPEFKNKLSQFIDNIGIMHKSAYTHFISCLKNHVTI